MTPLELPAGNPILLNKSTLQVHYDLMFNEALPEIDALNLILRLAVASKAEYRGGVFNLAADCCLHWFKLHLPIKDMSLFFISAQ